VMSATVDATAVGRRLADAALVSGEGRQCRVQNHHGSALAPGQPIDPVLEQLVLQALATDSVSLLVYLPVAAGIRRLQSRLETALADAPELVVTPLYGDLDYAAQRAAISPAPPGRRKVVLATPIAETSLTIDGVRVVIDSGLCREPAFDPVSGICRLHTRRISRAAAEQRAGRAGRTEPGVCYRLWSVDQHAQLAAQSPAEI